MAPRRINSAARVRRALLVDSALALVVALLLLQLAAGLGMVAVIAIPALLAGLSGSASKGWPFGSGVVDDRREPKTRQEIANGLGARQ